MRELSRQFVTVAEEVHFIYPEGEWALSRLTEDPGHLLFKKFGAQVPAGDWNDPGTKQGIYMMGPDGEYLEGAHAASGSAARLAERLERAVERWESLAKEKDYANEDVPRASAVAPPEIDGAPLALRVSFRDLPRGEDDDSGRRITDDDLQGGMWMSFTEWAWNQNWLTFDDPRAFVPSGAAAEPVPEQAKLRLVRRALVDNVRGQNPAWKPEHVQSATLTKRALETKDGVTTIEFTGEAQMTAGEKRYAPRLYGRATWNESEARFESFELVAIGERAGAAQFNQRARDKAAAPMGVVLTLHVPSAPAQDGED